jgi:hypothetical protein
MKCRFVFAVLLFTSLAGCAGISAVDAGKPVSLGDGTFVEVQQRWTRMRDSEGTLWTIDGLNLNELHFFLDVRADRPITPIPGRANRDLPTYKKDMLPDDVMVLTANTLPLKRPWTQVRTSNLRPAAFGSAKGFRFDVDFVADGLEMKGAALARQHGEHLDLLLFIGPSEFYFGRDMPAVEKIFESIRTEG